MNYIKYQFNEAIKLTNFFYKLLDSDVIGYHMHWGAGIFIAEA